MNLETNGNSEHQRSELADLEKRLDNLWLHHSPILELEDSLAHRSVAQYRIREVLGRGAFGIVYLADDIESGRQVALKVPRPEVLTDPEKRKRFACEAALAAQLHHPGIVQVYDTSLSGPKPFIAAAYCDGPNLAQWLDSQTKMPPWQACVDMMARLADAVGHAHGQGIHHRDLKPANVMLATNEQNVENSGLDCFDAKITDFGLAKLIDPTMTDTRSSLLIGTPMYMAPEQLEPGQRAKDGAATDIYALGVILFELLTGQVPVQGSSYFEVLENIRSSPPTNLLKIRKDIPRGLAKICATCLRKNPQARYASAARLAEDLRRCLAGETTIGRRTSLLSKVHYWCTHRRRMATAGRFTLGSQALLGFWISLSGIVIGPFQIVTTPQYQEALLQIGFVVLAFCVPMCWAGWQTIHGKRWGAWLALALTILNLPAVLIAIAFEPFLFKEVYAGHHPYFAFVVHALLLICILVQLFLLCCALVASRTTGEQTIDSNGYSRLPIS